MNEAAPRPPLFHLVDCIRIPVKDLDSGIAFYGGRLGHRLLWRTGSSAGLRMPGAESEIVVCTDSRGVEVDLLVDSADEAAARFREAGGSVAAGPFDIAIGRCAVVRDPWGNELVILDRSKGALVTDAGGNVVGTRKPGS